MTLSAVRWRDWLARFQFLLLTTGAVVIPMVVVTSARDPFRHPKELLFTALAVLLAGVAIARRIAGYAIPAWPRSVRALTLAILFWSAVATIGALNIRVSTPALFIALCALMVFATAFNAYRECSPVTLLVLLIPAAINSVIGIFQRSGFWTPFHFEAPLVGRFRTIALLGNPDDVGMYLAVPAIAAFALVFSCRKHRALSGLLAALILGGLLATETTTAIAAVAAGLLSMGFLVSRKMTTIILVGGLSIAAVAALIASPQRWSVVYSEIEAAKNGDFDPLLSGRALAFVTAWRMFSRHPLTGAGLGSFHFDYFDEKIAAEERFPIFLNRHPENFGETHNEHLQILAEAGLPGYALFVAALVVLGRASFSVMATDERCAIARRMALPSAITIAVLCLAQFPLRLAAPTLTMIVIVALTMSWTTRQPDA